MPFSSGVLAPMLHVAHLIPDGKPKSTYSGVYSAALYATFLAVLINTFMKVVNNNFFFYAEYATYGAFLGLALSK
jgi:hypothetical protein